MDEEKLSSICSSNSFYLSLADQKVEKPSQRTISAIHITRVHFAIPYEQHWAAVQLSITPFTIENHPGQTFHSSRFRYSLCCDLPPVTHLISKKVQELYDKYFHLCQWNFSLEYCGTYDSCVTVDTACAKNSENALLEYISGGNSNAPALVEYSNAGYAISSKRRKLNSYEVTSSDDDSCSRESVEGSVNNDRYSATTVEGSVNNDRYSATTVEDDRNSAVSVKGIVVSDGEAIADKILTGITAFGEKGKLTMSTKVDVDLNSSIHLESFIDQVWLAADKMDKESRAAARRVRAITWKYRLICSCLRIFGSINNTGLKGTALRWMRAARVVNCIVNGLWEHWGPCALLVYEALAEKNFFFASLARSGEEKRDTLVLAVIKILREYKLPTNLQKCNMFHPSAFISKNRCAKYSDVCQKLQLTRLVDFRPAEEEVLGLHVSISRLQSEWEKVRQVVAPVLGNGSDSSRSVGEGLTSPEGADHPNHQAPLIPRLNIDSAENISDQQPTAWDSESNFPRDNDEPVSQAPAAVPITASNSPQFSLEPTELPSIGNKSTMRNVSEDPTSTGSRHVSGRADQQNLAVEKDNEIEWPDFGDGANWEAFGAFPPTEWEAFGGQPTFSSTECEAIY